MFIADIYKEIGSQSKKFADDGTECRIGRLNDIKKLAEEIEVDFEKIAGWTPKSQMKIDFKKILYSFL